MESSEIPSQTNSDVNFNHFISVANTILDNGS